MYKLKLSIAFVISLLITASTCSSKHQKAPWSDGPDLRAPGLQGSDGTSPRDSGLQNFVLFVKAGEDIQKAVDKAKLLVPKARAENKRVVVQLEGGARFTGRFQGPVVTMAVGVDLAGQDPQNKSIIDGEDKRTLIVAAPDSNVRHLVLTNGIPTTYPSPDSPTSSNWAVYIQGVKNSSFENVEVLKNWRQSGGGFYVKKSKISVSNCTFSENSTALLIDQAEVTVDNTQFIGNKPQSGPAINASESILKISRSFFSQNVGSGRGTANMAGSIGMVGGRLDIESSRFSKNEGATGAVGLYEVEASLKHTLFEGNKGGSIAGALGIEGGGAVIVTNVTFANNKGTSSGIGTNARSVGVIGSSKVTIVSSILWGEEGATTEEIATSPGIGTPNINISYSDILGGYRGQGNIEEDPKFTADFRLEAGSPCVGSGKAGTNMGAF